MADPAPAEANPYTQYFTPQPAAPSTANAAAAPAPEANPYAQYFNPPAAPAAPAAPEDPRLAPLTHHIIHDLYHDNIDPGVAEQQARVQLNLPPPEHPLTDIPAAFADPKGLGANALQGATFGGAGYFYPEVKQHADAYAVAHPTASRFGYMLGGAAPAMILGPVGATATGAVAGGAETYFNQPPDANMRDKLINTAEGTALGAVLGHYGGKYLMPEASSLGTTFATHVGDTNLPTRAPVLMPAVTGLTKLGTALALAKHGLPLVEDMPFAEQFGAYSLGAKGLHDLYTAGKNVMANVGSRAGEMMQPRLSTPATPPTPQTWKMLRDTGGRYTRRVFTPPPPPPGRSINLAFVPQGVAGVGSAAPGVQQAQPYISDLGQIIAEHLSGAPGRATQ